MNGLVKHNQRTRLLPQVKKVILSVLQGATEGIDTLCSPWKTLGMTYLTESA